MRRKCGLKNRPFFLVGVLLPALLAGCSAGPKYLVKDYAPPARVAVLPFSNDTNDVEGPEIVRKVFMQMMPSRGYALVDKKKVDEVLKEELGISEGGQLNSVTPQKLGQALHADGLVYGNLISFVDLPFGFGRKKTVKADFKLVDAATGNLLWESEKGWTTPELHLNVQEAKRAAVIEVADRQIRRMNGTFLREETAIVVRLALDGLPPAGAAEGK